MQTTVDIPTSDGVADASLIRPDEDGPFPAVLLFMDAFGPRPRLVEMAERIAERGYLVLTPHLFYRGGRHRCSTFPGSVRPTSAARSSRRSRRWPRR